MPISQNLLRIQKYLADMGVCSRRAAEEHIRVGSVTINGQPASIGDKIEPGVDEVVFEGQKIRYKNPKQIVYALNKPRGFVCSNEDPHNERTVFGLVPKEFQRDRLFCAGRLDKDSEGLVILTNDGDLANRLMHPSSLVEKRYQVSLKQPFPKRNLGKLIRGVTFKGERLKVERAKVIGSQSKEASKELELAMHHGKKREIRNLFMALGYDVKRLKRYQIGAFSIKGVPKGVGILLRKNDIGNLFKHLENL